MASVEYHNTALHLPRIFKLHALPKYSTQNSTRCSTQYKRGPSLNPPRNSVVTQCQWMDVGGKVRTWKYLYLALEFHSLRCALFISVGVLGKSGAENSSDAVLAVRDEHRRRAFGVFTACRVMHSSVPPMKLKCDNGSNVLCRVHPTTLQTEVSWIDYYITAATCVHCITDVSCTWHHSCVARARLHHSCVYVTAVSCVHVQHLTAVLCADMVGLSCDMLCIFYTQMWHAIVVFASQLCRVQWLVSAKATTW